MGHYEVRKSHKQTEQPWYFVLVANNHEIIFTSEMYASKQGALKGIKSVQTNASSQEIRDKS